MPEMDGITATRHIKREQPGVSVLMVTMHENPDYLLEALDAGAAGYVLKDAPADRLINAVRRTLDGESPLNQELATRLLRQLAEEKQHDLYRARSKRHEPLDDALTPRETEVLGLLTTGQTNQQIAQTLTMSKGTAKVHVERIIRKLGVSDRTQAAVRYRIGIHFSRDKAATLFLKIRFQVCMPSGILKIGHPAYARPSSATCN